MSGILTPNFSSAATTTSTMDSESTSRSSVKDFSSATSSGFTPATSSRISARPEVMSARVAIVGDSSRWWGLLADRAASRAADDLSGVGEAAAEAEEQDRRARGHLPALDQLGQGQRHARRGGVAGLDEVLGDHDVGAQVQPLHDAVDDAGVGLVRDEGGQFLRAYAGL